MNTSWQFLSQKSKETFQPNHLCVSTLLWIRAGSPDTQAHGSQNQHHQNSSLINLLTLYSIFIFFVNLFILLPLFECGVIFDVTSMVLESCTFSCSSSRTWRSAFSLTISSACCSSRRSPSTFCWSSSTDSSLWLASCQTTQHCAIRKYIKCMAYLRSIVWPTQAKFGT